ncbi:flippase-like domain-containing protein [bacterium]|nr:flippase-like domain-containing protein [bacterium]
MKINKRTIFVLLITLIFVFLAFKDMQFGEFARVVHEINYKIIWLIVPVLLLSMYARGIRLHYLLSEKSGMNINELTGVCFAGSALNICLPARAGDFFRAYYLGAKNNSDKVKIFGSIVLERIFDGLCVLGLLFIGIMFFSKNHLAMKLCTYAAILFLGALSVVIVLYKFNKTDAFCGFLVSVAQKFPQKISDILVKIISFFNKLLNSFIDGFEIINSPKMFFMVGFWSVVIWSIECLEFYVTVKSLGLTTGFSVTLFISSFIALSSAIPSASIFVGLYQYAVIQAMALYHVAKEPALVFGIVHPFIQSLTLTLIGFAVLFKNGVDVRQISEKAKEET